jgi:hypothetical protein
MGAKEAEFCEDKEFKVRSSASVTHRAHSPTSEVRQPGPVVDCAPRQIILRVPCWCHLTPHTSFKFLLPNVVIEFKFGLCMAGLKVALPTSTITPYLQPSGATNPFQKPPQNESQLICISPFEMPKCCVLFLNPIKRPGARLDLTCSMVKLISAQGVV